MISLVYSNDTQRGDLVRSDDTNLDTDEGLETAVTASLFSDARAQPSDGVDQGADLRGWWGAVHLDGDGELGSRLWLLRRNKLTRETILLASAYAREALAWLISARVASDITVTTERMPGKLDVAIITIKIQRSQKSAPRFERKWEVQFGL